MYIDNIPFFAFLHTIYSIDGGGIYTWSNTLVPCPQNKVYTVVYTVQWTVGSVNIV